MAGTREGGLKTAATIKAKNPNHYREAGAKGGRNGKGHAFGHGKVDPVKAGRKGGLVKGELYKRNKVFQEYIPPVSKPVEEAPKRRFALWQR